MTDIQARTSQKRNKIELIVTLYLKLHVKRFLYAFIAKYLSRYIGYLSYIMSQTKNDSFLFKSQGHFDL